MELEKVSAPYFYNAKLIKCVDGDTIDFELDLGFHMTAVIRIRLLDVDAPEIRTKDLIEKAWGAKCTEYVQRKLEMAGSITVFTKKTGKYGRWLGTVWLDSDPTSLNSYLREYIRQIKEPSLAPQPSLD